MSLSARRSPLHAVPRVYTPPSPPTASKRRALGALRVVLFAAVTGLSVFMAGRIFLTGAPLGGATDLVTLYGATVAFAFALAGLVELKGSEDESDDGNDRGNRISGHISGVFRRTRDGSIRVLSKAMRLAHVG